jgi:hypothetical protein
MIIPSMSCLFLRSRVNSANHHFNPSLVYTVVPPLIYHLWLCMHIYLIIDTASMFYVRAVHLRRFPVLAGARARARVCVCACVCAFMCVCVCV